MSESVVRNCSSLILPLTYLVLARNTFSILSLSFVGLVSSFSITRALLLLYMHVFHSFCHCGIFLAKLVNFLPQLELIISNFIALINFTVNTLFSQRLIVITFCSFSNLILMRCLCTSLSIFLFSLKACL